MHGILNLESGQTPISQQPLWVHRLRICPRINARWTSFRSSKKKYKVNVITFRLFVCCTNSPWPHITCTYISGFGIRVLPTATKLDMHQLLSKGGVHRPDKGVMNNMLRRFANRVSLQIDLQDSEAMAVTYFDAAALPSTTTRRNLKQLGYAVGRPIEEGSVISYCFRTSEAISEVLTLKPLNAEETSRIIAFQAAVASGNNEQHHHVLQFSILEALVPNKPAYFIAPCMPATIAMIPGASLNSAVELWNQISSALTYIHSINFAHMDVKPSNIFVTAAPARFVLGDLGSIARVRFPTCSTRSFVPTDFEPICGGQFCASFAIDWWMLAITVLDFVGACHGGGGEFGLSCSRIQELLQSPLYEGKFQFIVQLLESSK
jgi:hypothetical protein